MAVYRYSWELEGNILEIDDVIEINDILNYRITKFYAIAFNPNNSENILDNRTIFKICKIDDYRSYASKFYDPNFVGQFPQYKTEDLPKVTSMFIELLRIYEYNQACSIYTKELVDRFKKNQIKQDIKNPNLKPLLVNPPYYTTVHILNTAEDNINFVDSIEGYKFWDDIATIILEASSIQNIKEEITEYLKKFNHENQLQRKETVVRRDTEQEGSIVRGKKGSSKSAVICLGYRSISGKC